MDAVNSIPEALPTVVLCCPRDMRHLLAPVLELLTGRGFSVEVVSGLEQRDDGLLVTAQRQRDAVYVLFSDPLPHVIDRATERLRQAGIPEQRVAIMPLEWRGPADVAAAIERMGVPMPRGPRRSTGANLPATGTVVSFPPPMTIGAAAAAAGATPPPRAPLHSQSVPVLEHGDGLDEAWAQNRRRTRMAVGAVLGAVLLTAVIAAAAASGEDEGPVATTAPWSQFSAASPSIAAPQVRVAGIAGGAATAGEAERAGAATPSAVPSVVTPSPAPVVAPAPVGAPAPIVAPTPVVAPAPVVTPAPIEGMPMPTTPTPAPEEVEIVAEPEIDEAEMRTIYAGLTAQKFRALDIVLIAPEPRKKVRKRITKSPARLSWAGANAYCEALEIGGVTGWRLPRVGELGSITRGALIADGKFWSQTEGDTFGRTRVVWNTQTEKMGTAPVAWKGGRVVCVRTMARVPDRTESK